MGSCAKRSSGWEGTTYFMIVSNCSMSEDFPGGSVYQLSMPGKKSSSSSCLPGNTVDAVSCQVVPIILVCRPLLRTGSTMQPNSLVSSYRNTAFTLTNPSNPYKGLFRLVADKEYMNEWR